MPPAPPPADVPALFVEFPALVGRLAHRPLGLFPTAIERVPGALPGGAELYVKREDAAGSLYGGNKIRKLELLLARPPGEGRGPRWLLTVGPYGSNHVLACGVYGRLVGYPVEAISVPQPLTRRVRANLRAQLGVGVRLWPCRSNVELPLALGRALWRRPRPLLVPPGGSSALGTLGWWSGGLEIAAQVAAGVAPPFDAVYVALGSGGTAAGLLLGLGTAARELVAVQAVPWPQSSALGVQLLARRSRRLLGQLLRAPPPTGPGPRLRVEGRFVGPRYGEPTSAGEEAIRRAAALGHTLDSTYTGKTFAALCADAAAGRLAGKRVLFINTYSSRDTTTLQAAGDLAVLPDWLRARLADSEREVR